MSISNYPGGFAQGIAIRGIPLLQTHPGKVFWVGNSLVIPENSIGGSDGNDGTFNRPFATLQKGMDSATASRGDIIFIRPGHAETVSTATALLFNKAGIAIIGLGIGSLRPTFTLNTAPTATIPVSAANISVQNVMFVANFADIVALFTTTTAKDFTIDKCEIRDTSSALNFLNIVDTNTTTADTDGLMITNSLDLRLGATSNTTVIKMDGTNARLIFQGNYSTHAATTAAGFMIIATGKVVTRALIRDNIFDYVGATGLTTGTLITTDGTTNSGVIVGNKVFDLDATSEILVTAASGFHFWENYSTAVTDASGYIVPPRDA